MMSSSFLVKVYKIKLYCGENVQFLRLLKTSKRKLMTVYLSSSGFILKVVPRCSAKWIGYISLDTVEFVMQKITVKYGIQLRGA